MKVQSLYSTVDVHVAGEAFRIIQVPPLVRYQSLKELDERLPDTFKKERELLLNEPRGFAGLTGCLVLPPIDPRADAAVLFFTHTESQPVHYGGAAAVITALLEGGFLSPRVSSQYQLETVSGLIGLSAAMKEGEVVSVQLESGPCRIIEKVSGCAPAFSLIESEGVYALLSKEEAAVEMDLAELTEWKKWGQKTLQMISSQWEVDGVIVLDESEASNGKIKSITFRKDGMIVRSPGFDATAACCAFLLAENKMSSSQPLVNESIFGSLIEAWPGEETEEGRRCKLSSRGFITGTHTAILDPTDPLPSGFLLK